MTIFKEYFMLSFYTHKILKINIIIYLTDTNEKSNEVEILELILPEEKVSKEKIEFNVRNRSWSKSSNTEYIQNMLENINTIIDIHEKNKTTHVSQLNITIYAPDTFPFKKTDNKITLENAQKIILSQKQVIEEIDSKLQKKNKSISCLLM
jgi:hypothetical protein